MRVKVGLERFGIELLQASLQVAGGTYCDRP